MRVIGRLGLVGVWIVGCGFDTGGVASGGASVGDEGNDTTAAAEGDDDAPDDGPDDDDDDDSATTPESGDPSSAEDPTGEPTSDPSGEPTTTTEGDELGTSGVTEPTTDGGDATTTTMEPTTDGGDDMPPENPYPDCSSPNACEDGAQNCIELTPFMSWEVAAHACAPPCADVGECPAAPEGSNASPACIDGWCRLECDPDATTCPEGMDCWSVSGPDVCLYDA